MTVEHAQGPFYVHAAEFTDMSFKRSIKGTEVMRGPFPNYQEALQAWSEETRRNIDLCTHKAVIEEDSSPRQ